MTSSSTSTATATSQPTTTHFTYLDEKWKLSKKEPSSSSSISRSRSSTSSSSFTRHHPSSSTHHRRCAFTRKCARLVKEQRARFYIMRRCVTMLVCWRDYGDS